MNGRLVKLNVCRLHSGGTRLALEASNIAAGTTPFLIVRVVISSTEDPAVKKETVREVSHTFITAESECERIFKIDQVLHMGNLWGVLLFFLLTLHIYQLLLTYLLTHCRLRALQVVI